MIFKLVKLFIISTLFIASILIASGFYMLKIEPYMLIVRKEKLYIPNWRPELNGLKVAIISDLHIGTYQVKLERIKQVVELINQQKPDLIFLLGDYDEHTITNSGINKKILSNELANLKARHGVIAILGNHDAKNEPMIRKILKNANIKILEDSFIKIDFNNKTFYIAGIKDYWFHKLNISGTLLPIKDNNPIIFLSHNPDVFPSVPKRVSLTLSGHTHGGAFLFPIVGGIFSPSKYGQKYLKGHIAEENKHLYVTSGVGPSGPARFGNPPEIIMLTLFNQESIKKPIFNTPQRTGLKKSLIPYYAQLKMAVKKLLKL